MTPENQSRGHFSLDAYHVIKRELCPLRDYVSVDGYHSAAIVVQAISVTAFLISKQIDPSTL